MQHHGRCHCGAIRYTIEAPAHIEALECNCSICSMVGYLHVVVPRSCFELVSGGDSITRYRFNTGVAEHTFCKVCGVKPFYVPRSNPDGYSVNARCLEPGTVASLTIKPFDGKNWEANAGAIAHLSEP